MDDNKIIQEQIESERKANIYRIYEDEKLVPDKINDEDIIIGG